MIESINNLNTYIQKFDKLDESKITTQLNEIEKWAATISKSDGEKKVSDLSRNIFTAMKNNKISDKDYDLLEDAKRTIDNLKWQQEPDTRVQILFCKAQRAWKCCRHYSLLITHYSSLNTVD